MNGSTLMLLVAYLHMGTHRSARRVLSIVYQHDRVYMVFRNLCVHIPSIGRVKRNSYWSPDSPVWEPVVYWSSSQEFHFAAVRPGRYRRIWRPWILPTPCLALLPHSGTRGHPWGCSDSLRAPPSRRHFSAPREQVNPSCKTIDKTIYIEHL